MLRTQKDVDKHVQDIFRKITNEKERNLRCYNVAKLYQKVGDYQSTKKYVELYLRDRPNVAGAHKLLGQALEGLKEYVKALDEYKSSLCLESRQPDLVLKVCELLVETKIKLNAGEVKYWVERAEEISDNHQAVFRLKEYLLKMVDTSGDQGQLVQLVEKEIEARPQDHVPRIKLLNLYLYTKRVLDAYKYAIDLESRCLFRDNVEWYLCVIEVLKAYQREVKNLDGEFYVHQLCVLERYVALCIRDHLRGHSTSFSNPLYALDQACFEASKHSLKAGEQLLHECVQHMSGQLSFHLGSALLRIGKQSRSGWKEWTPVAWALMTLAYVTPETIDFTSHSSTPSAREKHRKFTKLWKEDCAFRCSQAGHILLSMPHEGKRFSQLSSGNWQEKIFTLLFPVQVKGIPDAQKSSFFVNDGRFAIIPEVSPSFNNIAVYDETSQLHRPDSLHTLVWMGLRYLEPGSKHFSPLGTPYLLPHRLSPNFVCYVFDELKLSTSNLENNGVETLSKLDVDTFLYASVFCAAAEQEQRHLSSLMDEGGPSVLPVDLTGTLCTGAQSKWWFNAYRLHSNKSRSDIGEVRMIVSRGVEVVRLLGNHGMDVRLVVLLAKLFSEKASALCTPKDSVSDIFKRAQLFWQCAITMLERMEKNQPLRMSGNPLFVYGGKALTATEIRMLLEEGRFFMACHLMKEEKYEQAIEAFKDLKSPYASFYEGLMYKKLADAERPVTGDSITADMKSSYIILLQKSRSALYLTLDRLRSPQNAGNRPLNLGLEQHIEEVENCLAQEDNAFALSDLNRNPQQGPIFIDGDDGYFCNRFEDSLQSASRFVNTTLLPNVAVPNGRTPIQGITSTPVKSKHNVEFSMNFDPSHAHRAEARPSPERLDAQIRRMAITTDSVMQVVVEQNRQMLASNKTMMEALDKTRLAVEELQKQMGDLRLEVCKLKVGDNRPQTAKNVDYLNMVHAEEECDYNVADPHFQNVRGFTPTASYAHFPGQGYNYDTRVSANTMPTMLPQALFPQAQVSMARNMDPNLLLASYYPQAVGLNFNERQAAAAAGIALPSVIPGASSSLPGSTAGLVPKNVQGSVVPAPPESVVAVDAGRKPSALIGAPILLHSTLPSYAIDLSASSAISSVPQSQQPPISDLAAQRFNISAQQGPPLLNKVPTSTESLPHNFQISMPPQATIPTTESLEKCLSPLKPISTDAILPNVPMPAYSAVSVRQSDVKNRLSTGSASGNDTFTEDVDYNPCADFKPIIPLPEEVTVTTGEEDETALFVRRAKLFRFVGGEWKERGVGDIKILKHNISGKPRILMRREQVLKICANHFILPEMELVAQTGSDRAWSWCANDFSDGEARIEKLCCRFKTVQDAQQYKEMFDEARKLAKYASPVKGSPPAVVASKSESKTSTTSSTPVSSGKVVLGGFSFISPPVLKPVERQVKTSPCKDKETASTGSKQSPFAGFSFTPSPSNAFGNPASSSMSSFVSTSTTSTVSTPMVSTVSSSAAVSSSNPVTSLFEPKIPLASVSSSGLLSDTPMFNRTNKSLLDFAAIAAQNKGTEVGKNNANFKGFEGAGSKVFSAAVSSTNDADTKIVGQDPGETEDFEPTAVFNPVVPLPSLVEVRTGEEDEDVMYEERAKLLRFDSKEWKERGIGKIKVLKNQSTGKIRLLMRREQVLKICCNHFVTPDIQFKQLTTSDKAITWSAQDFSEGEVRAEVFALRFKTPESMHSFQKVMETVQKDLANSAYGSPVPVMEKPGKKDARPLSELFKPKEGSWECSGCFTRNNVDVTSCPCCSQLKPGHEATAVESKPASSSPFLFGIKANSTDDAKAGTGFPFGNIATAAKDKQPSLAEMFKPKEGSWPCQECYTRCDPDKVACMACEAPKPGHERESKATTGSFSFGLNAAPSATFSFGIDQTAEPKAFPFGSSATQGESKPTFLFGVPSSTSTDTGKGFSFGSSTTANPATISSGFVFGTQVAPSEPSFSLVDANQPSFGSPHKFEFQMKAPSPAKSLGKSPGGSSGVDESKDDSEEENVDGDFKPVVPLPDKVPIITGEEDEAVLYSHRAKLFRFISGEWKERGLGDIKVLRHNVTNKPRLLMRREQVLKICLNHYIPADLELIQKDEKTWMWVAQDFSEGVFSPEKFACRFKTAEIAADFKEAVEVAKNSPVLSSPVTSSSSSKALDGSSDKEVTPSTKTVTLNLPNYDKPGVVRSLFSLNNESSLTTDEVEVLYEAKVSPEEKAAALMLLLPENFYRYKQAPPCKGCPGCEKDSDSDPGEKQISLDSTNTIAESSSIFSIDKPASSAPGLNSGTSLFSSTSFSTPSSTSIFGGSSNSTRAPSTPVFASLFGAAAMSSASGSTAVNSHSTAFPLLGSKFLTPASKEDKSESISFLPVSNSPSFASLAAANQSSDLFKQTDAVKPFSFDGAGAKVFGAASSETLSSKKNDDDEDSGGEHNTSEAAAEVETHDPHFEPIIAMPDMVEVRTGEEEEEKVFCRRSKLYRYDTNSKEWKERGVGEMKILKHPVNGTFRLLLRREQVHKVVLNQRLDSSMQLKPMFSSDRAWCWGGMNYAEEQGALEELAIRFKNSEEAEEFRLALEDCMKQIVKDGKEVADDVEEEEEEDNDDDEDEDDDDEDYEDEENGEILFEKHVTLAAEVEGLKNSCVKGNGDLRIIMQSNHSYIVEMEDDSGELLCRTPILGDAEVQREENVCTWKSTDLAEDEDQGIEKTFVTTFESESDADAFQDLYSKLTLEIVELTYDHVGQQED